MRGWSIRTLSSMWRKYHSSLQ